MDYLASVPAFVKKHLLGVLVTLLVALLCAGYALGFRPGPGLTLVRTGTLVLASLPAGATAYADESKRGTADAKGQLRLSLVPGDHSILVDAPGDYPWDEIVTIPTHAAVQVAPLLVSKRTQTTSFTSDERPKAQALVAKASLPTAAAPLALEKGCALVRVVDNRILANAVTAPGCTPSAYLCTGGSCADTVIFSPVAPLRSVLPYPGRQDALIVAYGDTLAVLELNPLSPQYFAPILRGLAPAAASWDARTLAVTDDGRTFKIVF